ncbi:MAG: hypothetical protein V1855_02045 [bacterium]
MKIFFRYLSYVFMPCILSLFSVSFSCAQEIQQEKTETPTCTEKIRDCNMRTFAWEEEHFSTDSYEEYLNWYLDRTLNPKLREQRKTAFHFMEEQEKKLQIRTLPVVRKNDEKLWENLDLFCASKKDDDYVAKALNRMRTQIGCVTFFTQLAQPIIDVDVLTKRQDVIKACINDEKLHSAITYELEQMKLPEKVLLTLWQEEHFRQNVARCYFTLPGTKNRDFLGIKQLNASNLALLAKSLYGHGDRFILGAGFGAFAGIVLLAYGGMCLGGYINDTVLDIWKKRPRGESPNNFIEQILGWKDEYQSSAGLIFPKIFKWTIDQKWLHGLAAILGGTYCATYALESFRWAKDMVLLETVVQTITIQIAQYLRSCKNIYTLMKSYPTLLEFDEFAGLREFFEDEVRKQELLNELMQLVQTQTLDGEASVTSNKGVVLRAYDLMYKVKEKLEALICAIGKLDMYASCATLYKEFENKRVKFCFANFVQSETPFIQIKEFWHPLIKSDVVVPNDVTVGTQNHCPNMIITGPNAAGKSCILKALTLCLLLSQTVGIAPASSFEFSPFKMISTHLNLADDINAGSSLFKAEVLRAQELIDSIQGLNHQEFSFVVFDEIFKGTTPLEGTAAAYGVSKHLGQFANSISLIATHFEKLTELETDTKTFENYKVMVFKASDGSIGYPFKLFKGISDQHVALDILKNEGIDGSVIQEAEKIVQILG